MAYVHVDIEDYIGDFDTQDLIKELESRGVASTTTPDRVSVYLMCGMRELAFLELLENIEEKDQYVWAEIKRLKNQPGVTP